jgi:hypothetical protein
MSAAHIEESPPSPRTSSASPPGGRVVSTKDLPGDVHRRYLPQVKRSGKLILTR